MEREREIRERVNRRAVRLERAETMLAAVGLFTLVVFGTGGAVLAFVPLHVIWASPLLSFLSLFDYVAFSILLAVAAVGGAWLRVRGRANLEKQIDDAAAAISRMRALQAEHPELVQLDELRELLDTEKAQRAGRRSFWVSILVNVVFTLLGFALSYAATKLGWLR